MYLHNIKWYYLNFFGIFFLFTNTLFSQSDSTINLSDIWEKRRFFPSQSNGLKFSLSGDGYYQIEESNKGNQYSLIQKYFAKKQSHKICQLSGLKYLNEDIEIEDYELIAGNKYLLIKSDEEPIYRRSSVANFYLFNTQNNTLVKLSAQGKISNPSISPNQKYIAFTRANNIFIYQIENDIEKAITSDGEKDKIINGSTDWVYEEELEFTKAYVWTKDSKQIAFIRFDEQQVPKYSMQVWENGLYPRNYEYKYPKAGEANSKVSIGVYQIYNQKLSYFNTPHLEEYIARIYAHEIGNEFIITTLNRAQNHLRYYAIKANEIDSPKMIYEEKNENYIEINDNFVMLPQNKGFIISSEKDGYRHCYHINYQSKKEIQLTSGKWEVEKIVGFDSIKNILFYTSNQSGLAERQLYSYSLNDLKITKITLEAGVHDIEMSPNAQYYIDSYSSLTNVPQSWISNQYGKKMITLSNNFALSEEMSKCKLVQPKWIDYLNKQGDTLKGILLKPNISKTQKHPVLIYLYGGPGAQEVKNEWMGANYFWFQHLVQKGYVVFIFDGRGTGGRGTEFKKCTQYNLGALETEDLISTAEYLSKLDFVDPSRIGVFGWSFGGYMVSLGLTKGAGIFKMGIAVAPVISWRFYDTIYTERYLGLPSQNAGGYDQNSPLNFAGNLQGKLLLIHGTADDNVHIQNSIAFENALIKAGKQFTAFHYPDRNHGIYGQNTRMHLYQMMTQFILENL
jgi:dipeptidyl-peptidase-4